MRLKNRPGFTLAETLVTLMIMGIVATALTRLMVGQSQFFNEQSSMMNARSVSRSPTNLMMSELRMIETGGGVVAASKDSITIRVPYRMGIICANAGVTTVSFLPVDSAVNAAAALSGYAWRDSTTGRYSYVSSGVSLGTGASATCTAVRITPITNGQVRTVTPPAPLAAVSGTPLFLYQTITYRFANSTTMPGNRALFRSVVASGLTDELVVPFDTAAKFRFYSLNARTAADAPPSPLSDLRGVELVLPAINERSSRSGTRTSSYTTSVFFKNRLD